MSNDWILDVLTDLQTFAQNNGMPRLSAELRNVARVAEIELIAPGQTAPHLLEQDRESAGRVYKSDGARGNAGRSH
ncbi:MAG: hypothetical protein HRU32_07840 [Rhodobacteraceae bacterium]|nr:hypothetical protein [Paracoccaceae bacterium]